MRKLILKLLGIQLSIDPKTIKAIEDYNYKLNCHNELSAFIIYLRTKDRFKGPKAMNPSFKYAREYNIDAGNITPVAVGYIEELENRIKELEDVNNNP